MTIVERVAQVFEDEKKTKSVLIRSWEISGVGFPREKNVPVRLKLSCCPPVYMNASHQDGDLFLAFPISCRDWLKLKWHRFWLKKK